MIRKLLGLDWLARKFGYVEQDVRIMRRDFTDLVGRVQELEERLVERVPLKSKSALVADVMSVAAALATVMVHCTATKPDRIRACREACAPETVRDYADGVGCTCN